MQTDASKCRFLSFQYELSNKKIRGGGGYPEFVNPVSRRNVPTRTSRESLTSKRRRRGQIIDGLGPSMGWVGLGDEKWTQGGSNKCPAPAPCTLLSNTRPTFVNTATVNLYKRYGQFTLPNPPRRHKTVQAYSRIAAIRGGVNWPFI